jgi:hypothetical protein
MKGKVHGGFFMSRQFSLSHEQRTDLQNRIDLDFTEKDFEEIEQTLTHTFGSYTALRSAPRHSDLVKHWKSIERLASDLHRELDPAHYVEPDLLKPESDIYARADFQAARAVRDGDYTEDYLIDKIDRAECTSGGVGEASHMEAGSEELPPKLSPRVAWEYYFSVFMTVLAELPDYVKTAQNSEPRLTNERGTKHFETLVHGLTDICLRHNKPSRFTSNSVDDQRTSFIANLAFEVAQFLPKDVRPNSPATIIKHMARGNISDIRQNPLPPS